MKCAILSDVHANNEALTAVLASEPLCTADAVICLGDMVGYYASPNECLDSIRRRAQLCIAGNHDLAALGRLETRHFGRVARHAIEWTSRELSGENREFIANLPQIAQFENHFVCVHGALHPKPNATLHLSSVVRLERSLLELRWREFGARICLFGHTHHAVVYSAGCLVPAARIGAELELSPKEYYLINPGSVGQSRDADPRASFAVYDTRTRRLTFHRVAYDLNACLARARNAGLLPEPSYGERVWGWLGQHGALSRNLLETTLHNVRRRLGSLARPRS